MSELSSLGAYEVNRNGGHYLPGATYAANLRSRVAQEIDRALGDEEGGERGVWASIARRHQVSAAFVSKIRVEVEQCRSLEDVRELSGELGLPSEFGAAEAQHHVLYGHKKGNPDAAVALDWQEREYLVLLVLQRPTAYLAELQRTLEKDLSVCVSVPTICEMLKRMGLNKKVLSRIHYGRLTRESLDRRAAYVAFASSVDPARLFFFDESGFNRQDVFRKYGRGFGLRVESVGPYIRGPNWSLLAVLGLRGVVGLRVEAGSVDAAAVVSFFVEEVIPHLVPGSIVVLDNAAIHHGEAGEALEALLREIGCYLAYLPPYSPDLNPIENSFGTAKSFIKQDMDLFQCDPCSAIVNSLLRIPPDAVAGWYHLAGYL